jgi:phosphopantetheine adenylyltransferase
MKAFSQFLFEAEQSQAVMQAKRLGLSGDGHGGWYDKNGEFVAKTVNGRLKFYNQNQLPGKKDPNQDRTAANQRVAATQVQPSPEEPKKEKKETKGTLTVAFGRFNPPTTGHEKLLDAVAKIADKGEYKIYPSRSNDPKKNPLDPDTKISVMRQMYPKHGERIVNDANSKTIFDVLKQAHADGYSGVNIVVGSDRQAEFEKLANQYNGQLYDFANLNVVSAGERDPDAEGVEGMSASKLRKAAAEGDFKTFRSGVSKTLDDAATKQLYNTLRKSMKIKEGWSLWEIAPKFDWKNLRENYITQKVFNIGQLVENLNTGLVGKIIRRGTNYLICVTEDDIMFKSWIKDVTEAYTEVKMDRKMRDKKHPNTLIGTLGYFKYAAQQTPGSVGTGKENLAQGQKAYGINFINKYKAKSS